MSPAALSVTLGAAGAITIVAFAMALRSSRRANTLAAAVSQSRRELEHLERAFARFAPDGVVERIAGGATEIVPVRRVVTVLFADLVGFTRLSEQLDPAVMVTVLNGYFRAMSQAIAEQHGHVSRIMGDGLMALFGAFEDNPWQAADAVRAALGMRAALVAYNAKLAERKLPELALGVGVHCGDVVAGVIGSSEMMEFTVLGDPVNIAARVEALTRTHAVDILVTEDVRRRLDDRFVLRAMPPALVKGKSEPIGTFAVERLDETSAATQTQPPEALPR